jgi:hypothetical protein
MEYVPQDAPRPERVASLKLLERALRKTGEAEKAKSIAGEVTKLEKELDDLFRQHNLPFAPPWYVPGKARTDRVAVVELFTGAHCLPCVAADLAFDLALTAYHKSGGVIFLQYHLPMHGPDLLVNADAEGRRKFYSNEALGRPLMLVNGKPTPRMDGFHIHARKRFEELCKHIDPILDTKPEANLELKLERKGDDLSLRARVTDLEKTGERIRLRILLVENEVRYVGANGRRLHNHVVREFLGGLDGFPLKEASTRQPLTVRLSEVRERLDQYLTDLGRLTPLPEDDRPTHLRRLKVVVLVQDNESKAILQALQMEVPEKK